MVFFCLRENSEFGSYPGSNVPVLCPSDYCGSSSKKVLKYFTVFMKNVIKKNTQFTIKNHSSSSDHL